MKCGEKCSWESSFVEWFSLEIAHSLKRWRIHTGATMWLFLLVNWKSPQRCSHYPAFHLTPPPPPTPYPRPSLLLRCLQFRRCTGNIHGWLLSSPRCYRSSRLLISTLHRITVFFKWIGALASAIKWIRFWRHRFMSYVSKKSLLCS